MLTPPPHKNPSGFTSSARLHDQVPPPGFFCPSIDQLVRVGNMNQFWNHYWEEHKLFTTITQQERK